MVNEKPLKNHSRMPRAKWMYAINAMIVVVCALFSKGSLDIATHDTYFVIATSHVLLIIAFLFLFFSITEWSFEKLKRKLSYTLSILHYSISTVCVATIIIMTYFDLNKTQKYQDIRVVGEADKLESYAHYSAEWFIPVVLLLIIAQLILLANISRSLLLKTNR